MSEKYNLRYLPLFERDLLEVVRYISEHLKNPVAAENLIDEVERAIFKRLESPLSFEPFRSGKQRQNIYYRIYVGNYAVFYAVIDDVMEIRRFIYGGRDMNKLL